MLMYICLHYQGNMYNHVRAIDLHVNVKLSMCKSMCKSMENFLVWLKVITNDEDHDSVVTEVKLAYNRIMSGKDFWNKCIF